MTFYKILIAPHTGMEEVVGRHSFCASRRRVGRGGALVDGARFRAFLISVLGPLGWLGPSFGTRGRATFRGLGVIYALRQVLFVDSSPWLGPSPRYSGAIQGPFSLL